MYGSPPRSRQVQLLREIANGPNSSVFVADASERDRHELVAVKLLGEGSVVDKEFVERQLQRAQALHRLAHRHIVAPRELATVDERLAIISPYIDGVDLMDWQEVLRETGVPMPGRVNCTILRAMASALHAAQLRTPYGYDAPLGLCHLDLKPANVLIDRDGEVKITDFSLGLTSLRGQRAQSDALQNGLSKYMAPERRAGERGSAASDIYSLGIIGIELFRRTWLKRLRTLNPAHDRHLAEVVASLGDLGLRSNQDERTLQNTLLRMVAFDVDARPTAGIVLQTFQALADRAPGHSLESFAQTHATPWLEPVSLVPEPELATRTVRLTSTGILDVLNAVAENDVTVQMHPMAVRELLEEETNETTLDEQVLEVPGVALGVHTTSERTRPTFTLKDLFEEETSRGLIEPPSHSEDATYVHSVSLEPFDPSQTLETPRAAHTTGRRLVFFAILGLTLAVVLFAAAVLVLVAALVLVSSAT